jgi:type IV pilus assembly protein PilC
LEDEMQEYICTVKKGNGNLIKNYKVKVEDESSLIMQIKSNKLFLVDYKLKEERKDIVGGSKITLSTKDIAILCRQLSSMLSSGVTLVKALNILYLQMEKKNIKACIKKLYESVQRGDQFSEGIRKQSGVFPEIMISMVEAGEASGKLDHVITKLAEQFEKDVKLKAKIQSAMTYPIILMVMAIGVVLILVTQVLPIFMGMFAESGMVLPLPTQILIAFSNILRGYWYLVLIGIAAIVLLGKSYLSSEAGLRNWHSLELRLPIIKGTVMKISAVRFTRTLSTLLSSGMSLLQALEIVIKVVGNRVVMDGLNITKEDIRRGMSLSQSLRKVSALPPMVYSMIGIGEEAGTIENMLEKCAEYYDDEVENAIQKLVTLMEPLMIVFMGVVVGFIIISMILPIFDLYGSVQ